MKKKVKVIIAILLIGVLGFLGYGITNKLNYKKEVAERIKTIPDFSFVTTKEETFTQNDLKELPTVFIYFNSDCDYCQSEATKIEKRLSDFKNIELIFVSFEPLEDIIKFAKIYKLYNQENITFLEDKKGEFSKIFDVNSIPYIIVYNKKKEFKGKFKGATKIDKILKVIK